MGASPATVWSEFFLARLPEDLRGALVSTDLEDRLLALLQRVAVRWPQLEPAGADFVGHLAERLTTAENAARAFDNVQVEDLYLAFSCAKGDRRAMQRLDEEVLSTVPTALARWNPSFAMADDVTQLLRQKLLVKDRSGKPRIAEYSGRGPLVRWVRAAAIRTAVDLGRTRQEALDGDQAIADWSGPGTDPELDFIKRRYRGDFAVAFRAALERLSPQERNVLRLHLVEGLNIEQIGRLFGAHRATVARWIAKSREALLLDTRAALSERLRLSRAELESLIGLFRSQLDLSINRYLGTNRE